MKILNDQNKVIGKVEQDRVNGKPKPFNYRYIGLNNITFPISANDEAMACYKACKFFGAGYSYLLFTI